MAYSPTLDLQPIVPAYRPRILNDEQLSQRVKFPSQDVEATSHASRYCPLGTVSEAHDLKLDGTSMYYATDGCGEETTDFVKRPRRKHVKGNVANTGSTAPATIAGASTLVDAEVVLAMILIQMLYPGAPNMMGRGASE